MNAPICASCLRGSRLTNGREVYAHRRDLWDRHIWKCDGCGGYVGCHPRTTNPLGTPAGAELRKARSILHERMIDPLWLTADACGLYTPEDDKARWKIRRAARTRVYRYLAHKLSIDADTVHVGMFDLETCRRAWVALRSLTYPEIRDWSHQQRSTDQ